MLSKKKTAIAPRWFYTKEAINLGAITPLVVTPVVIVDCRLPPVVISMVIVPELVKPVVVISVVIVLPISGCLVHGKEN